MRIVFDVDDTISVHENRDYANAKPKKDVIRKLNYMHDVLGYEIVLHTSRGMLSCDGNIEIAESKNRCTLEKWLKENDVHYDEIIFGKPFADLYVDDRCINLDDFMKYEFCELKGGSGKKVSRLGNIVKKETTHEKVNKIKNWTNKSKGICKSPKIISSVYDSIYMEYINGTVACNVDDYRILKLVVKQLKQKIEAFSNIKVGNSKFNVDKHVNVLLKNTEDNNFWLNERIRKCIVKLYENKEELNLHCSFCHGDLILSNIIIGKNDGELYFIDPEMDEEASSYLLDLAKLRMSLMGYENIFGLSDVANFSFNYKSEILKSFDNEMKEKGIYDLVILLNYMYVLRLWRYKPENQKYMVKQMIIELEEENEDLLK